ncbi:hypothetical protein QL285_004544 [Trifolium repens]|nr:hypothetical protein QL285_004544 [Trifolium repens]
MGRSITTLTQRITDMLLEGSDFLIEYSGVFELRVDELISCARRLSMQQMKFLTAVIRLKAELVSRGPLISYVEDDLFLKNEQIKSLYYEGLDLKESMTICLLSLVAFTHEKAIIGIHKTMDEFEAVLLSKRKLEIRSHIHDNIIELLKKKQNQQNLQIRMREIRSKKEQLMEQMDIVEESKEMIEDLLAEAIEAAESI